MLEKLSHMVWFPENTLDGVSGNLNYAAPEYLPDPCYICGVSLLEQSNIPTVGDAILMVKMDHEGRFAKSTGFPASETCGVADPNCHSQLMRLAVLDYRPGAIREVYRRHDPVVRWSRSKGDLIQINGKGIGGAPIQICVSIEYLRPGTYTSNDESQWPPIVPASPSLPPGSFGTWAKQPNNSGGRTVNASHQFFALNFPAPDNSPIATVKFKIVTLRIGGTVHARLLDNGGAAVGLVSSDLAVNSEGEKILTFPTPPPKTAGEHYWMQIVSGSLDADIEVCDDDPAYQSGRGALANNLPGADDFRFLMSV